MFQTFPSWKKRQFVRCKVYDLNELTVESKRLKDRILFMQKSQGWGHQLRESITPCLDGESSSVKKKSRLGLTTRILQRDHKILAYYIPLGSMRGIFTHIYYENQRNVVNNTSPMDPMG